MITVVHLPRPALQKFTVRARRAVVLDDTAAGVRDLKRHGGRTIVEDPATALAAGMPSAALATGCVDMVMPLARIPHALIALTTAPGAADLSRVPPAPWANLATSGGGPRTGTPPPWIC
jgi:CheB methylesterase